jgi:molecular chaperone GrpE (heat shock protein)
MNIDENNNISTGHGENHDSNHLSKDWKDQLRQACSRWIDSLPDNISQANVDTVETPDLYTFFASLNALQTETRKNSRKTAETLSSFDETLASIDERITKMHSSDQQKEHLRIITIVDSIERIQVQIKKSPLPRKLFNDERWTQFHASISQAVNLLLDNSTAMLKKTGIAKIPAVGQTFDPSCMSSVEVEYNENMPDNQVVEEFIPGYVFNETILRYSEVKVNRRK